MTAKKALKAKIISGDATTFLVSLRARYEDLDELAARLQRLIDRLNQAPGFASIEVIRREGGLGVDFYTLARFNSRENLDAWKHSPERNEALAPIEELAITDISRQQASGSNIWFEPVRGFPSTPEPPLLWKRWLLSMIAVYPALIVLINVLRPISSRLPEPLGIFLVAAILTGLTTTFIVPWLTRTLHTWLSRH